LTVGCLTDEQSLDRRGLEALDFPELHSSVFHVYILQPKQGLRHTFKKYYQKLKHRAINILFVA